MPERYLEPSDLPVGLGEGLPIVQSLTGRLEGNDAWACRKYIERSGDSVKAMTEKAVKEYLIKRGFISKGSK